MKRNRGQPETVALYDFETYLPLPPAPIRCNRVDGVSSPTVKEGCLVDALVAAQGRVAEAALANRAGYGHQAISVNRSRIFFFFAF